jgi:hypothetical protein
LGRAAGSFAGVPAVSLALGSTPSSLPAVDTGSAASSWVEPLPLAPHPHKKSTEQKLRTALTSTTVAPV